MGENKDNPASPTEPTKPRTRKWWGLIEAIWDSACDMSFSPLNTYIKGELPQLGSVIDLILLFVIGGLVAGWWLRSCHANSSEAFLQGQLRQSETRSDKLQTQSTLALNELRGTKDSEIIKLTVENTLLQNRIATIEAIPSQVPSLISDVKNLLAADPTNRIQLLGILFTLQSLTNALADIALRPTFDLYINGTVITNESVLDMRQSQLLRLRLKNTSPLTAEQVTLSLNVPLGIDVTNVIADGGTLAPADKLLIDGKLSDITAGYRWFWQTDKLLQPGAYYDVGSLRITTNIPYPVVKVFFDVYSARSKTFTYLPIIAVLARLLRIIIFRCHLRRSHFKPF